MSLKTINDLTAVDESQLQNNALIEGAIPPVSGSLFAPVKVTLEKLAKWILNSYTGLSLAGSSQSVKAAVDGLNGNLTDLFVISAITYSYSIEASGNLTISASDLGISPPTGYSPLCFSQVNTSNNVVVARGFRGDTASGNALWLHNLSASAQTGTLGVRVVYVRSMAL